MKRLLLIISMVFIASVSFAQSGKWAAGVTLGYGSDISKPSIGVKALYDISDHFTVAPSFNYYFQKKEEGVKLNAWDINADLHWNVLNKDNFKLYPLAGITYLHYKASANISNGESFSDSSFGANLGIGTQVELGGNWAVSAEVKYQILDDGSQFVPAASVMYKF